VADYDQPIIIKKIKKAAHVSHGGAWKIAYADFVTAMMAFFLLLWLISMTTDEQKKGLADYFSPPNVSATTSGAGGVLGGTALEAEGGKLTPFIPQATQTNFTSDDTTDFGSPEAVPGGRDIEIEREEDAKVAAQEDTSSKFDQSYQGAAASVRQAWQALPDLTNLADNIIVEETREGLNIVISDDDGRPMFPEGSKFPTEAARQAIAAIAPVLSKLPNQIDISGHTAAGGTYPNPRYGPWELSSDRANVVRAILGEFGLGDDRIHAVAGRASAEPFFPNDPYLSGNERIEILVLNEAPPVPPDLEP
jgi:chemotaxis protein MotB